jgi:hypothetical protein
MTSTSMTTSSVRRELAADERCRRGLAANGMTLLDVNAPTQDQSR